jgi:transposase InsO family protein
MNHADAPLTAEGRLRLVRRCEHRPIAHVAAEAGVSRQCPSKWKARFDELGEVELLDRASVPHASPTQLDAKVVVLIESWRRVHKWSARAIHLELARRGHDVSVATVGRWLVRLGISRRRDIDPDGQVNRTASRIVARYPSHTVHLDVKKVGRIPDGGGWRAHGRGSATDKAAQRSKAKGARAFFAAHGISRPVRVVTDNGPNYTAKAFIRTVTAVAARHQCIRPHTPRHNGKVKRYNRFLAEELLYARVWTSEAERAAAIKVWNVHYNCHRCHTVAGDQTPGLTPPPRRHRRHEPEHPGWRGRRRPRRPRRCAGWRR